MNRDDFISVIDSLGLDINSDAHVTWDDNSEFGLYLNPWNNRVRLLHKSGLSSHRYMPISKTGYSFDRVRSMTDTCAALNLWDFLAYTIGVTT